MHSVDERGLGLDRMSMGGGCVCLLLRESVCVLYVMRFLVASLSVPTRRYWVDAHDQNHRIISLYADLACV